MAASSTRCSCDAWWCLGSGLAFPLVNYQRKIGFVQDSSESLCTGERPIGQN
jgi:hypothetical protein